MSARTIGTYELEGLLGEGGIGQVYAAHDTVLGRKVAIKMLRPELSRDRNFVERFYVEAQSLGNLNHSNITTIYALHVEGDEAFMVMELVHGQTLEALLARAQRLTLRDSLAVLAQAVVGMRYAHRRGVIHRDLKPANLMVTDDGIVKIMDFGIARVRGSQHLTRVGEFCGTFVYASPEQIRGEEVDERSDLYSLAIVFYRMLAGTAPFTGDNEYALMTAQLQTPPPPLAGRVPDLEAATEQVLMRALAKRREDRFASVEEFGRAIGAMALRGESVEILTQLYARAFEHQHEDLEATRIVGRPNSLPGAEQTMPSNRRVFQLSGSRSSLPSLVQSRPVEPAPSSNRPARQSYALMDPPVSAVGIQLPPLPASSRPSRRPLVLSVSAVALSLSLLAGGGYYWTTLDEASPPPPIGSLQPGPAIPPPLTPVEVAKTQSAPALPAKVEPSSSAPPPPAPVEVAKNEPAQVEPAKVEPAPPAPPPPAAVPPTKAEPEKLPLQPVQTAKAESATAPPAPVKPEPAVSLQPPDPIQKAKDAPPPPAPLPPQVEPVKVEQVPPTPPPVPTRVEPVSPPTPNPVANSETRLAVVPPPVPVVPATPETKAEPQPNSGGTTANETSSANETSPANGRPAAGVQVAKAEQRPPSEIQAPLGPQAQPTTTNPEGEPDLQGRVSGAKRLDELEVAGRWIKLYGIIDRARGAREAQQVKVLLRYLKPARNVLVCYRKPGDTYRCYADGQDIAQLALLDGIVQLAPNAPAEYRALLAQKR